MTGAPSTKQVVRGRCPIDPKLHPLTHLPSFVGARPSSAAPVDQKPHPLTHICSSVGARPSPAAPVDQKPHPLTHVCSSVGARPSPATPVDQKPHPLTHICSSVGARPSPAAPVGQNHLLILPSMLAKPGATKRPIAGLLTETSLFQCIEPYSNSALHSG
jgi:hypothetical protein